MIEIEAIRDWAESTDAVRAAILTGSRAVSGAELDEFSDFDVILFLRDPETLNSDEAWLTSFGTPLVMLPTSGALLDRPVSARLVVYREGHRIDFTLAHARTLRVLAVMPELPPWLDAGYRVLVDKDGDAGTMCPPQGRGYAGRPPEPDEVLADVQEFWWEALVVAKALARGERHAAAYSAHSVMRHGLLRRMLEWRAQMRHGWSIGVGPYGRGLDKKLPEELLEAVTPVSGGWSGEEGWNELTSMADLFASVARDVTADVGGVYPDDVESGVRHRVAEMRMSSATR